MKWQEGDVSADIEDRRGQGGGFGGGGGGFRPGGGMRLGLGGTVVVLLLSVAFKTNFFALLGGGGPAPAPRPAPSSTRRATNDPAEQKLVKFVSFVLDDVQKFWDRSLPTSGRSYTHAKLVLFTDAIDSACGSAESAMGPFYCPGDRKVYIDLGFYDELKRRFGAPGEFAQAYVIAHEVGHHVQNLLGTSGKVHQFEQTHPREANQMSVKLELQADCLAGVWAASTQGRGILEPGDVESALGAAAAVGDDRLQKQATGRVNPESWTHGSSAQRMEWFKRGMKAGNIESCNTFGEMR